MVEHPVLTGGSADRFIITLAKQKIVTRTKIQTEIQARVHALLHTDIQTDS